MKQYTSVCVCLLWCYLRGENENLNVNWVQFNEITYCEPIYTMKCYTKDNKNDVSIHINNEKYLILVSSEHFTPVLIKKIYISIKEWKDIY